VQHKSKSIGAVGRERDRTEGDRIPENPAKPKRIGTVGNEDGVKAEELVRKKDPLFKEKYSKYKFNEHEWIKVMHENPTLIERPVIVKGNKAVIARPMDKLTDLIG